MRFLLIAFLLTATPALAHIVADPNTGASGAWFHTVLRVTHGCEGKDTTAITVTVPSDILIIKPQVKPGWTIDVKKHKLDKPVQGPHALISEVTDSITWRGGPLPDGYFDDFGLSLKLPVTDAKDLALPVRQICGDVSVDWQRGNAEHPAPVIQLGPAAAQQDHHH